MSRTFSYLLSALTVIFAGPITAEDERVDFAQAIRPVLSGQMFRLPWTGRKYS